MPKMTPSRALWAMLILVVTPAASTADDHWQFGLSPSLSSGKYGTDTRTEVLYTPITARRLFDSGDITFVFPFTCIRGNEGVTVVTGSIVQSTRTFSSGASRPAVRNGTLASSDRGASTDSSGPARNCGMGDIVLRGRYYLVDQRGWAPTIAVRAHVKTPTASAERGLGTGRLDEGVGIEVTQTLAGGVMAMADGGYTVLGKPAGVDFNNNWWYDVGIGQNLAKGAVNLSVFFEEYRAIMPGFANARVALATVTFTGASGWRIQLSGEVGLSDGAPDHGVTLGASRRF